MRKGRGAKRGSGGGGRKRERQRRREGAVEALTLGSGL